MSKHIKLSSSFRDFDFLSYYKSNRSEKYIYRCLACHYLQTGRDYGEVSLLIMFHKNSLIDWVKKFEAGGIDSLLSTRSGRGRRAKLSTEEKEEFSSSVVSLQDSKSGGRVTGDDIVKMVEDKYNITYSRSGVYKLLSRMGISWVSARSKHPNSKPEDQDAFKKTL